MARNSDPRFDLVEADAALIAGMKPIYADVFSAWLEEDGAYGRMAAKLNIPVGTVKSRLYRARQNLDALRTANKDIA
ncbi:sigma factor-like helix-turn-helix DNA-binding protein [Afipia carboxidovorans]|uniref:sigma factor-like helix-turn-helix DNA-binding protein n=1 Tax=Afipia carboxidovorans TaxID=40137 RepID=UPI00308C0075|nr:hypothetical protein CRBSH125_05720 [Afipia carboxidovorans]